MLLYLQISAEDCTCRHRNFSLFTRTGHAAEIYAVSVRAFGGFTRLATPRADRIGRKKRRYCKKHAPVYDQCPCTTHMVYSWAYSPTGILWFYLYLLKAIRWYIFCFFMKKRLANSIHWMEIMVLPSSCFFKKNNFCLSSSKRCIARKWCDHHLQGEGTQ